jgi:toxin ParE1/3/4
MRSLCDAVSCLKTYPNRGRAGKKPGTRELVVRSSPYVVVYQVSGEIVYVARILHGAQKWPE